MREGFGPLGQLPGVDHPHEGGTMFIENLASLYMLAMAVGTLAIVAVCYWREILTAAVVVPVLFVAGTAYIVGASLVSGTIYDQSPALAAVWFFGVLFGLPTGAAIWFGKPWRPETP
jgi:hypothetical protein